MAIPDVTLSIQDGALGLPLPNTNNQQLKIGISQKGTVRTIYSFSDQTTLYNTLGDGPLTEAAAHVLAVAGGPVLCMPATITTPGSCGAVTHSGTGTAVFAVAGAAYDSYSAIITITTAGASLVAGTAQMQISLDGGLTQGPVIAVPTSGTYVIPNTNITITITTGTFVVGDTYSFTSTAPAFSSGELTSCVTAALADSREWFLLHVVGAASAVAGAASLAATLDTLLVSAANAYRFARGLIEIPADTDGNIIAAFAASSSLRVGACAGFASTISSLNGRQMSRSSAWDVAARLSAIVPSEDAGRVARGSCPGLTALSRDERSTPGLDAARLATLRTIIGRQGFYITNARLLAPNGSDYTLMQYGRVVDLACKTARNSLLNVLNASVRTNANGTIYENDARTLEAKLRTDLAVALLQPLTDDGPGYVSSISAIIDRTNNILSSQTLNVTIRLGARGYAKTIAVSIGFASPALAVSGSNS